MAALIPNILAIVTLFFCLRKFVKPLAAWCGIILFAFSFPMVYYGFVARGYSLMVLFFIIGFFSVIAIMQNPDNKNAWFRLMISSVLGFYTIPVYLYPFVSMMGFVFIYFLKKKDLASILRTLKFGLATCILTLAVYTPIFAINGIGSVTNNKFVTPLSLNEVALGFKQHLNQTIQFFTLSDYGYLLIILVIVLVILIFKNIKSKSAFYLSVFIIIITPAFIFIHKVLPVERTWIYLMVVFIFLICVLINNLKWPVLAIVFSFIYSVIVQVGWNKQMLWYDAICKEDYLQGKHFSDYFHNKKVSIVTTSRMNTYLKFNKLLQNENWQIETDSIEVSDTCYYIHYKEKDKYPPTSFKKIGTNGNYELYLVNIE